MRYLLSLLLFISAAAVAQDSEPDITPPAPACNSAKHRQFDFWVGDWNVTMNGEQAGTNSVKLIQNDCVLQENWQGAGAGGVSGTSFNIYDRANDKWHQTWVDSTGTLLELDGRLVNGIMVLEGRRPARVGGGMDLHRISFTPNEDDSVRQLWEASKDDGRSWSVVFDGLYAREIED